MTTFDQRKDAYETKFARDEELRFKATARRNKLLGLWAAEKLGRTGEEAELYAREVVRADMLEAGDSDLVHKIMDDFTAAGVQQSEHQVRRTMEELLVEAVAQIEGNA
jgi:hypothetical protein